jgi:dihydrofolate reductase
MRKLILQMQISVDGFVGTNAGHDWQVWGWGDGNRWDEELKADFNAYFRSIDMILLSRKMAEEGYLTHWGKAAENYPRDPFYAFARRIVEVPKVVASDKLKESRWERTSVCGGDLPRDIVALKAEGEGNIAVFGGSGFASALSAAGLVDEFQFYVNPAVLGDGERIFAQSGFRKLALIGSKAYACGIVVSKYSPAR